MLAPRTAAAASMAIGERTGTTGVLKLKFNLEFIHIRLYRRFVHIDKSFRRWNTVSLMLGVANQPDHGEEKGRPDRHMPCLCRPAKTAATVPKTVVIRRCSQTRSPAGSAGAGCGILRSRLRLLDVAGWTGASRLRR